MLTAFIQGVLLIFFSELGDKTFFIGVCLSFYHPRALVFIGTSAALASMTVVSVLMGQVASLLPPLFLSYAEILLFLGFGLKLLWESSRLSRESIHDEAQAASALVQQTTEKPLGRSRQSQNWTGILLKAFSLTFVAEWGDRTQIATIALAANHPPLGIVTGAVIGHAICCAIAVNGGRLLARHLSERLLALSSGYLFLLFSAIATAKVLFA